MFKLWKIIPHSWMTKPCKGDCGSADPHSHDTTPWFHVAYGVSSVEAAKRALADFQWRSAR